ncbi:hypothetical protein GCM10007147_18460 [Nocardiopsis kunsanensis]|uniref:Uncharacterized protein n=1 Tax=Nocardiopsis kunsanensis TaxID=141693 RepID=A0A918XAY9_9ACTN|nr:hypothetical protein GCM10007147_18460 [Nocardiopsis kunsanensis]
MDQDRHTHHQGPRELEALGTRGEPPDGHGEHSDTDEEAHRTGRADVHGVPSLLLVAPWPDSFAYM